MANKDFNIWLSTFRESIANYQYYIDFNTVYKKCDSIKVELNILNSLVGSNDIENDFETLIQRYPDVLKCIPILLAKREMDIYCMDHKGAFNYNFKQFNYPVSQYKYFMKETGLFELLSKKIIKCLVDYVMGVEVGLNSNGRKNRGGHLMEDLVESYIQKAGYVKGVTYFKEMYISDLEAKTGLDLSSLSNAGKTEKRFDYVILTPNCTYACECNFYASNGSKLNETARSYKMLSQEANTIDGFTFVWFTDGVGWKSARGNLRETFEVMDTIYSIDDMENGIMNTLFR